MGRCTLFGNNRLRRRLRRWRTAYALGDLFSSTMAWGLSFFYLYEVWQISLDHWGLYLGAWLGIFMTFFGMSGFYYKPFERTRIGEFVSTMVAVLLGILTFYLLSKGFPRSPYFWHRDIFVCWLSEWAYVYFVRAAVTFVLRRRIRRGRFVSRAVILGDGAAVTRLADAVARNARRTGEVILPLSLPTDEPRACRDLLLHEDVERLYMTESALPDAQRYRLVECLYGTPCEVYLLADDAPTEKSQILDIHGEALRPLSLDGQPRYIQNIRRFLEIFVSIIGLILTAPLLLVMAWRIRRADGHPAFYAQERIGRWGRPFTLYKLRTMRPDAEHDGPHLSSQSDERITPLGHFLRRYRIDELPQLWNVLRGDMGLVSYRPERRYFIDRICRQRPEYILLLRLRPGLTSWGMVRHGYASTFDDLCLRLSYDLHYIDNNSLLLDAKILLHTVGVVFHGRGV